MASIKKLDNGWRYRVSYKKGYKPDGSVDYGTKTQGGFRTKKECELAAAEIEKKYSKGYDLNAGDRLFSEYMRNWFEVYQKNKHSKGHERNIERSVELVEKHFIGVTLKELNRDMYQRFINEISPNLATDTVKKRHTYIKAAIKEAIQDGVIYKDPTYKITFKGGKESKVEEMMFLHFDEVLKLVEEMKKDLNPRYISRYILLFTIATGARFSETMGLTWDSIDWEGKSVNINKTWDFVDTNDFGDTKNYASKRTITIDDDTLLMLKELKNRQNKISLSSGLRNKKNLVFIDNKFKLVSNNAVNKTLRTLCRKVNVTEVTCHGLRHTHASMLLYKGANVKYISRRLGHKDIVTTLQTYSHVLDEMEQKESRLVDQVLKEVFAQ